MGCSGSRHGVSEPSAQQPAGPSVDAPPLDGTTFADIVMRFMMKNPDGPTMEQGALLEYIRRQGTTADQGDTTYSKTPVQYASQHRLVIWLIFIIHRLNVSRPEFLSDAVKGLNVVDPRLRDDLEGEERRTYDQVLKLLTAPDTATFLPGHYQRNQTQTDQALTDAFTELSQTVPDASDIPDEPPRLGAWMMARNVAEIAIEGYSGGLWGLFTSCLKLAGIVKRWSARSEELLAWKTFAEAHRGMVESARKLNAMADDPGIDLNAKTSNDIKQNLKEWISSVQGVVEGLCKDVETAIADTTASGDVVKKRLAMAIVTVLEKRAHMNLMLDNVRQQCDNNAQIYSLQTTVEKLQEDVARFRKLDTDLEEAMGTLQHNTTAQDQVHKALKRVLRKYRYERSEGNRNGAAPVPVPDTAAAAPAPAGAGHAPIATVDAPAAPAVSPGADISTPSTNGGASNE